MGRNSAELIVSNFLFKDSFFMFAPSLAPLWKKEIFRFRADHIRFASEVKSGSGRPFSSDSYSHEAKITQ